MEAFPPVEGFLQKKGGGTSLLGSKAWAQRYIRIENGNLSWWKRKEDAVAGVPPQKGARIKLSDFFLEVSDSAQGKYYGFKIVAKDKSSLTTPKMRPEYEFRVHEKQDLMDWAKVFRVNGCVERGREHELDHASLQAAALEAAAPKELLEQMKALSNGAPAKSAEPAAAVTASASSAAATSTAETAKPSGTTTASTSASSSPPPAPSRPVAPPQRSPTPPAEEPPVSPEPDSSAAASDAASPTEETTTSPTIAEPSVEPEAVAADAGEQEEAINESDPNSLWRAYRDEEGDVYYSNRLTGESQWEAPEGFTREPEDL